MSYAVTERKRQERTKVDGGSSIEVISAGFKDGNMGKIMLNGNQVLTTANSESKIGLKEATMSSNYRKGDINKAAQLAIDGDVNSYFHTKCGADEWWSAQFGDRFVVSEVRIRNRIKGADATVRRLQKAEITIEGKHCGFLPESTPKETEWFTVKC